MKKNLLHPQSKSGYKNSYLYLKKYNKRFGLLWTISYFFFSFCISILAYQLFKANDSPLLFKFITGMQPEINDFFTYKLVAMWCWFISALVIIGWKPFFLAPVFHLPWGIHMVHILPELTLQSVAVTKRKCSGSSPSVHTARYQNIFSWFFIPKLWFDHTIFLTIHLF